MTVDIHSLHQCLCGLMPSQVAVAISYGCFMLNWYSRL